MHLKRMLDNGRKNVNQLHSTISNRDINLSARRLPLLSRLAVSLKWTEPVKIHSCLVYRITAIDNSG